MSKTNPTRAIAALAAGLALAHAASAASIYDSGTPAATGFGLELSSIDWLAADLNIAHATTIDAVSTFLTGANAGETFTIALYLDRTKNGAAIPDTRDGGELYSTQVTFTADGWNGATNLGWNVAAPGNYWVSIEVDSADTLSPGGSAVLPVGAPNAPLGVAFTDGVPGRFQALGAASAQYAFGLKVSSVVPEPASPAMLLAGMTMMGWLAVRRGARR